MSKMDTARQIVEFVYLNERSPILGDGELLVVCYETEDGKYLDYRTLEEFTPTAEFSAPRPLRVR